MTLIKMMKELVDKYPEGYEGFRDKAHSAEEAVAGSNDKPSAGHKEFETDELTSKTPLEKAHIVRAEKKKRREEIKAKRLAILKAAREKKAKAKKA
ncbi:hypothetical protein OEA41_008293 [Lepraria neglecta]|uniref:Uncharacterized protein n=1 Tax=Lepraria neglecta TaxID=209136 RepID=A0AAE0DP08_9LECA|nr:hypothetical protein OEA41_008293 [Lepraria neglecta]